MQVQGGQGGQPPHPAQVLQPHTQYRVFNTSSAVAARSPQPLIDCRPLSIRILPWQGVFGHQAPKLNAQLLFSKSTSLPNKMKSMQCKEIVGLGAPCAAAAPPPPAEGQDHQADGQPAHHAMCSPSPVWVGVIQQSMWQEVYKGRKADAESDM